MTNKLRCEMDYEKIKLPVENITFLPRKNATYVYFTVEKIPKRQRFQSKQKSLYRQN